MALFPRAYRRFNRRERAALAWTEALTLVARDHVRDDLYAMAKAPFPDEELVNLTAAVVAINGGNRVAFRFIPPVEAP